MCGIIFEHVRFLENKCKQRHVYMKINIDHLFTRRTTDIGIVILILKSLIVSGQI